MKTILIKYGKSGPTNIPDCVENVILYGRDFSGMSAEGPTLGNWDELYEVWSDERGHEIDWHPTYFAVSPENPEKSFSEPTVGGRVL